MTGPAWTFAGLFAAMLIWNAYLMWVNAEQRRITRRANRVALTAQAARRPRTQADFEERLDLGALRGDLVIPEQRQGGDR